MTDRTAGLDKWRVFVQSRDFVSPATWSCHFPILHLPLPLVGPSLNTRCVCPDIVTRMSSQTTKSRRFTPVGCSLRRNIILCRRLVVDRQQLQGIARKYLPIKHRCDIILHTNNKLISRGHFTDELGRAGTGQNQKDMSTLTVITTDHNISATATAAAAITTTACSTFRFYWNILLSRDYSKLGSVSTSLPK